MDKKESIKLFKKGKEAWNVWAKKMLSNRNILVRNGGWQIDKCTGEGNNQETIDWLNNATSDFSEYVFKHEVDFSNFIFPGKVKFTQAIFNEAAWFNNALFKSDVDFYNSIFCREAWFEYAEFNMVYFIQSRFESHTSFKNATFNESSFFSAMRGFNFFSLKCAKFSLVPDFEQAHFLEAPHLDASCFQSSPANTIRWWELWKWWDEQPDIVSRWRALKRLAIQGNDHDSEVRFFTEELKSQRFILDKPVPNLVNFFNNKLVWPGGGRFWFGVLYQLFSDFGRSILRPLLWWILFLIFFTLYYFLLHINEIHDNRDSNTWKIVVYKDSKCFDEKEGNPLRAALNVSINNSLLFAGYSKSNNLSHSYSCLYEKLNDQTFVKIPDIVVYAGICQTISSAVLIFLFLLALRNNFKIK